MSGHGLLAEFPGEPRAGGAGVGEGFERGEGLRRDDEQRRVRIGAFERVREPAAVDVGDERALRSAGRETAQRFHCHRRPEIRATDADVDDEPEWLAGAAGNAAAAHAFRELQHPGALVEDEFLHFRAADTVAGVLAQRHVQHGALLGLIDDVAAEHRGGAFVQPDLISQRNELPHHLFVDEMTRVVQQEAGRFARE
jgi:hypothetical protein